MTMTNRMLLLAIIGAARGLKKEEAARVIETLLNEHEFDDSHSLADAVAAARERSHPFVDRIASDKPECSRCGLANNHPVHQDEPPVPFSAEELAEFKAKDRTRKMSRFVLDVASILEESPLAEAARVIKGRLEDSGLVEKPKVKVGPGKCGGIFMSVTGQASCGLRVGHVFECVSSAGEREKAENEGVCIEPIKINLVSDDNPPDRPCILNKGHEGPHVSCWGDTGEAE